MKEDLKTIFYMGLGAISETNEKMKEVKEDLYARGKELYEKGIIANEELKRNISETMKENVTVVNVNTNETKEDILKNIAKLSEQDREDLINTLHKKGWTDAKNERKGNKKA